MKRFLLVLAIPALSAEEKTVPFQIPPHGKPELLLGDNRFQAPTAMAFDSKNRPYLVNNRNPGSFGKIQTIRDGQWVTFSMLEVLDPANRLKTRELGGHGEIVIDDNDCIYATPGGQLVYSADLGKTFKAYPVRGSLELRTSSTPFSEPPAICVRTGSRYVDRGKIQQPEMAWWAQQSTLKVLLPKKTVDGLELGMPIFITDKCVAAGSGGHSGGTSFAVTIGRNTHIVYAELTEDLRNGGNRIHVATLDRETRKIIAKTFLVTAPPVKADNHTRPTITADSKGYLHVLSGSHGEPFFYMRSLRPNDSSGGWTKPVQLSGRQCYASIVCDGKDRLHSVFREWLPHPSLGYSSANAAGEKWSKPRTLVIGANPKGRFEYGIFYHRLFIDRASTLYLAFTFFEFKTDQEGNYPEVLVRSKDGGASWQIVDDQTFPTQS